MEDLPPRPATPQVLLHRLPDKPDTPEDEARKPSKYIVLIMGSTAVTGKVQTATSVAKALGCPLLLGDSLHESSAKAANVGASRPAEPVAPSAAGAGGPNEARYRRMWLSKLTRTGMLFPEESRPATEGFSGFGGTSSTSTSRRGSASSVASEASGPSSAGAGHSRGGSRDFVHPPAPPTSASGFPAKTASSIHKAVFTLSEEEKRRRASPALMVLTHPELEAWHKVAIRSSVGDYGLGVIFVPLYDDGTSGEGEGSDGDELPVLQPLDPRTMTSFPISFGTPKKKAAGWGTLGTEIKIRINVEADVESKIAEIIELVRDVMGIVDK